MNHAKSAYLSATLKPRGVPLLNRVADCFSALVGAGYTPEAAGRIVVQSLEEILSKQSTHSTHSTRNDSDVDGNHEPWDDEPICQEGDQ